jgi:hypothetical protein
MREVKIGNDEDGWNDEPRRVRRSTRTVGGVHELDCSSGGFQLVGRSPFFNLSA